MADTHDGRTFDPARTPGAMGQPPAHAPREVVTGLGVSAEMAAHQMAQASANEKQLKPLVFAQTQKTPAPAPAPKVVAAPSPSPVIVTPSQSRLRVPGQARPPVTAGSAESITRLTVPTIILTDVPGLVAPAPTPTPIERVERPAVDPAVGAHLNSPLADAARRLAASRAVTHQPAASDSDSPSRGIPQPSADPGKRITGGFGDAGDAQYYPLDGSELRELVRGLMSVLDEQMTNDLRFSMAICYPRVAARVTVEVLGYGAGGDGGHYDPSFTIEKVMPPHDKTPLEIARERADAICFVIMADRREMTADGQSIAPPNQIREELGLVVPRKQAISTPQGRLIVDVRA